MKLLPLIAFILVLHTPVTYTFGDESIECPAAAAISTVAASAAIALTMDTCMRHKRSQSDDNRTLKRALICTTVGTIVGAVSLIVAAAIVCSDSSQQ